MTAVQSRSEAFERAPVALTERITSDGSARWPVEPGRYRLVAARACPWANRSVVVRRVLGSVDALKLRSSMTLFEAATPDEPVFGEVLGRCYGGRRDEATTTRL